MRLLSGFLWTKTLIIGRIPDRLTIPFAEYFIQAAKVYLHRAQQAPGAKDALVFSGALYATFDQHAAVWAPRPNRLKGGFDVKERWEDL